MAGRFFPFLLLSAVAASGCASVSEERVAALETAVSALRVQEIRVAVLEDRVNALASGTPGYGRPGNAPAGAPEGREPVNGPRGATPAPSPAHPRSGVAAASSARASGAYKKALATLEAGGPAAAMALFRDFLSAYPKHELAPNAGYWLGECHYTLKEYDSAIIAFKDVVAQHPSHEKAADAMLKAGYSYVLLNDTANARFYLDALLKDYPDSRSAPLARAKRAAL